MTVRYMTRRDWTTHGPVRPLSPFPAGKPVGLAIHYTGSTSPIGNPPAVSVAARLESYRVMHTSPGGLNVPEGGNDIAYNACVDQAGRIWPLRTEHYRSGANGSGDSNGDYGALLLMLGAGDEPSPAMIEAAQTWRRDRWLPTHPRATKVIGHLDVYPTDCPGGPAYRLVKAGVFGRNPGTTHTGGDDNMPTLDEIGRLIDQKLDAHDEELIGKLLGQKLGSSGPNVAVALQSGSGAAAAARDNSGQVLEQLDELQAAIADLRAVLNVDHGSSTGQ